MERRIHEAAMLVIKKTESSERAAAIFFCRLARQRFARVFARYAMGGIAYNVFWAHMLKKTFP